MQVVLGGGNGIYLGETYSPALAVIPYEPKPTPNPFEA